MKKEIVEKIELEIEKSKLEYIEATPYRNVCFAIAFIGPILVCAMLLISR